MNLNILFWRSSGYKDWLWQRISAIIFLLYVIIVVTVWYLFPGMTSSDWRDLLHNFYMQIFASIATLSVLQHAWIGLWTIITDYIKPRLIAKIATCVVLFVIFIYFLIAMFLLWGL